MARLDKYLGRESKAASFKTEAEKILSSIMESDLTINQLNAQYQKAKPLAGESGAIPTAIPGTVPTAINQPNAQSPQQSFSFSGTSENHNDDIDLSKLQPFQNPDMEILQDAEGNMVLATKKADPFKVRMVQKTNENYDHSSFSTEEDDIVAPLQSAPQEIKDAIDAMDNESSPKEDADDSEGYDVLIAIPKLSKEELNQIIQIAGNNEQVPQMMKELPLGSVSPVNQHVSLPMELDTMGLSVAGMENDLALKFL